LVRKPNPDQPLLKAVVRFSKSGPTAFKSGGPFSKSGPTAFKAVVRFSKIRAGRCKNGRPDFAFPFLGQAAHQ